ncbi:hypothetical protein ACFCW2_06775 [Qipengyuania sp. DSG2-2]|uniref:hypothetical protein n=1 Tax=Qipengyuania sp. DGS2-2 TaxID=3349631 RepID=UPI0036D31D22
MFDGNFELVRLAAFLGVMVPALVDNIRTGQLPNWSMGLILVAGIVLAFVQGGEVPWLFWIAGVVVGLALFVTRVVPAGVVKFLIAFLPWFFDPSAFLIFFTVGFLATVLYGKVAGRTDIPIAPGFFVAGLGVFGMSLLG